MAVSAGFTPARSEYRATHESRAREAAFHPREVLPPARREIPPREAARMGAALRWVTLPGIDESMVPPPGRSLPIVGKTGRKLLLLRTHRGELSCLDAACFHQGEDLSNGEIHDIESLGTVVQCPRHGARAERPSPGFPAASPLPLPTPRAACAVCSCQAAAWMP